MSSSSTSEFDERSEKLFSRIDADGSGGVSAEEVVKALEVEDVRGINVKKINEYIEKRGKEFTLADFKRLMQDLIDKLTDFSGDERSI